MTRIVFDDLRLTRSGHRALDGVSGVIEPGTITAVLGPSGAGKSSLLAVLAGLVRPDRGSVRIDEDVVSDWPPERRGLGVVFQDLRLFEFLSGRGNVGFAPRLAGVPLAEQARRVDEALSLARAEAFAHRPARVLSGGERQRIAFARALAMRPRALLLDEPFSAVDTELRRTLREELRTVVQRLGYTTLLVTHDRDDVFALASRLLVLREGRIEQSGDPETLYRRPVSEFVARLLGEATVLPMSARDGDRAQVLGQWIEVAGPGERIVLRPEDLELTESAGWRASLVDARYEGARFRLVLALSDGTQLIAYAHHVPQSAVSVSTRSPVHALR